MAYKCPCDKDRPDLAIGRSIGSNYMMVDQQLQQIEKVSNYSDPQSNHYSCPWQSYKNSLWIEVMEYLNLKEIPGTQNINDNTPNVIYEAVLFYHNAFNRIDNHVVSKEMEKFEEERKKSKTSKNKK